MRRVSLSIVVMAYNEESNIGPLLEQVEAWAGGQARLSDYEVVVVDDGSTDGTADVVVAYAQKNVKVRLVRHLRNSGMGAAIRTGYDHVLCEYVTQLPADGQVPPQELDRFLAYVPECDLVLSVYDQRGDGLVREVLSWGYKSLARLILGQRADYTGTMVFRRTLLYSSRVHSNSFVANLEFPLKALNRGARAALVTFRPSPRMSGVSKVVGTRRILNVAKELVALRIRGVE